MSLKQRIKKNKTLMGMYRFYQKVVYGAATIISPTLNTKMRYRQACGKRIDLKHPTSFSEKLLWLKLNKYINDPLVIQCADKYRVREYIENAGCGSILNDLIGVWDSAEEISWDALPEQFALKWNFGAGMNIICSNKNELDRDSVVRQMKKWGRKKIWLPYSELQYKYAPKKIICEKYLSNDADRVIADYKVYCFHGEPQAVFVMSGRGYHLTTEFFDTQWKPLENSEKYEVAENNTEKPQCLEQMLAVSRKLSTPFPFVRLDYYVVNDRLYFGEMTFTPAGGLYASKTKIQNKDMADFIHLDA